jgi:hypothetical protein
MHQNGAPRADAWQDSMHRERDAPQGLAAPCHPLRRHQDPCTRTAGSVRTCGKTLCTVSETYGTRRPPRVTRTGATRTPCTRTAGSVRMRGETLCTVSGTYGTRWPRCATRSGATRTPCTRTAGSVRMRGKTLCTVSGTYGTRWSHRAIRSGATRTPCTRTAGSVRMPGKTLCTVSASPHDGRAVPRDSHERYQNPIHQNGGPGASPRRDPMHRESPLPWSGVRQHGTAGKVRRGGDWGRIPVGSGRTAVPASRRCGAKPQPVHALEEGKRC